jgi:hypothetical protein
MLDLFLVMYGMGWTALDVLPILAVLGVLTL